MQLWWRLIKELAPSKSILYLGILNKNNRSKITEQIKMEHQKCKSLLWTTCHSSQTQTNQILLSIMKTTLPITIREIRSMHTSINISISPPTKNNLNRILTCIMGKSMTNREDRFTSRKSSARMAPIICPRLSTTKKDRRRRRRRNGSKRKSRSSRRRYASITWREVIKCARSKNFANTLTARVSLDSLVT